MIATAPYLLDDEGRPVPFALDEQGGNLHEYYAEVRRRDRETPRWRLVAHDEIVDGTGTGVTISTIFCLLDQRRKPKDAPQLFETCCFGGRLDGRVFRYATREEAEEGHRVLLGATLAEGLEIDGEEEIG